MKARDLWWGTRETLAHGMSAIYKFPHTQRATPTFFGRNDRMEESFKDSGLRGRGKQNIRNYGFFAELRETAIGPGSCANGGAQSGG